MKDNSSRNPAQLSSEPRRKTISGYLASSLDLEEQITNGVYRDYRFLKNWPKGIDRKTFDKIKTNLNTLIDETEQHKKIFRKLQKKL